MVQPAEYNTGSLKVEYAQPLEVTATRCAVAFDSIDVVAERCTVGSTCFETVACVEREPLHGGKLA